MSSSISLSFDSLPKIQDLGFFITDEQYTHPTRNLDWNVFLYVAKGEMEVWEDGQEYIVKERQFLFLESGLDHWGEPKTPAGTSWYWIHYYPSQIPESFQEINQYVASHKSFEISEDEYNLFIRLPKQGDLPHSKMMEKKLDQMIELFFSSSPYRAVTLSLQTMEFFISVFRELSGNPLAKKSDQTVQKVIEYLESKEKYYLDSRELEEYLNMNYSYLCDVFKAKTGNTIHMYNSRIFIGKAIEMLQNSNMNISEISDVLGFKNSFYFSRVFKKVMGCAPSNYINRIY